MVKSQLNLFTGVLALVLVMLVSLSAVVLSTPAAADDAYLQITVQEDTVKAAPTATPNAAPQHWGLAWGETATVLCGIVSESGIPAGEMAFEGNGSDSIEIDCQPWSGGGNAGLREGETDQHLALPVGGHAFALCGVSPAESSGGEFVIRLLGLDVWALSCVAPGGTK